MLIGTRDKESTANYNLVYYNLKACTSGVMVIFVFRTPLDPFEFSNPVLFNVSQSSLTSYFINNKKKFTDESKK